jgi:hypothetical protein
MKRIIVASLAGSLFFFSFALPASAHMWLTDGNIAVVMHVNPNDAPLAGQPAELLFGITDETGNFIPSTCKCEVAISGNGGREVLNAPLNPWTGGPSIFNYQLPFTFPDPAVYQIVVTGSPGASSTFQNFQVTYYERVAENPNDPSVNTSPTFDIVVAGSALLVVAAIYFSYREAKRQWKEN